MPVETTRSDPARLVNAVFLSPVKNAAVEIRIAKLLAHLPLDPQQIPAAILQIKLKTRPIPLRINSFHKFREIIAHPRN